MKNYIKIAVVACTAYLAAATASQAQVFFDNNWYAGISGDVTWQDHSDTGGGVNLDLGYRIMPDVRVEAEAGYAGTPGSGGYSQSHWFSYMANAYYDFNKLSLSGPGWHLVPYLGAGLGVGEASFGDRSVASTFHHHDTDFAYQGAGGVTLAMDAIPSIDWSLGYKYFGMSDNDVSANNIELGLHYHF